MKKYCFIFLFFYAHTGTAGELQTLVDKSAKTAASEAYARISPTMDSVLKPIMEEADTMIAQLNMLNNIYASTLAQGQSGIVPIAPSSSSS